MKSQPRRSSLKGNRRFAAFVFSAALGLAIGRAQARQPAPSADPYRNNADAGNTQFPLAAPAGKDSGAIAKPLPGAVNQGAIHEKTGKDGHAFDHPGNTK